MLNSRLVTPANRHLMQAAWREDERRTFHSRPRSLAEYQAQKRFTFAAILAKMARRCDLPSEAHLDGASYSAATLGA